LTPDSTSVTEMSTKLERLIWIDVQILCEKYPTAKKVQERFDVECRVAYLDREFMAKQLGAPIKYSRKDGGWYYKVRHKGIKQINAMMLSELWITGQLP